MDTGVDETHVMSFRFMKKFCLCKLCKIIHGWILITPFIEDADRAMRIK